MSASVNDKFRLASGTTRPVVTSLASPKANGATTAILTATTGWNTTTGLDYVMYRRQLNTTTNKYEEVAGTRVEGRATLTGSTLSGMTFDAGTEPASGYAADGNTIVLCAPIARWGDDMVRGILTQHKQDGTHADVITTNAINENTSANGVTVDGVLLKDNQVQTNNAVPANALATSAITLAYVQITANFSTANTAPTQVTGLSAAVTIPAGGRRVKITAYAPRITMTVGTGAFDVSLTIWDGTVGTGTQLTLAQSSIPATNYGANMTAIAVPPAPSAGAKTYNVGLNINSSAANAVLLANAAYPAFILVEAI